MKKQKVYPNTEWQQEHKARCLWEIKGPGPNIPWISCYVEEAGVVMVQTFCDGSYTVFYANSDVVTNVANALVK